LAKPSGRYGKGPNSRGTVLLAAGGTGGHLFPAEALAHELVARGYVVHLATDERAKQWAGDFPAGDIHILPSATFAGRNPFALVNAALKLFSGYLDARRLIGRLRPIAVAGFGGYPTVPPLFAAIRMGVATLIHDSNAVMGRANKWLAPRVNMVAMGFAAAGPGGELGKAIITGNPVRPAILQAAGKPYPIRKADGPFDLLVFGGSQGAQYFGEAVPAAVKLLAPEIRSKLRIVQQARMDDEANVKTAYREMGVKAEVAPFFTDMAERLIKAHLVICRAGASTVSELAVVGRPAILVPYPYALDHDQAMNAQAMAQAGGARIEAQKDLTPERLTQIIGEAVRDPAGLALAAEKAKRSGKPDAAARLADCVEHAAGGGKTEDFKGMPA
jgi:UDP-N-acetylglucosamine--N-acetylmuramyl-(pentapeptide) pyrophosphoryl-undecaprenol N-acetylglucosamine transferase